MIVRIAGVDYPVPDGKLPPGKTAELIDSRTWASAKQLYDAFAERLIAEGTRRGRASGGRARAASLTPAKRKAIAKKAAKARWG